jgi:hypothetical protein
MHCHDPNKGNVPQDEDPTAFPLSVTADSVLVLRLQIGNSRIDKALHRLSAAQARCYRVESGSRPFHRANSGISCFAPLLQVLSMRRPSGVG